MQIGARDSLGRGGRVGAGRRARVADGAGSYALINATREPRVRAHGLCCVILADTIVRTVELGVTITDATGRGRLRDRHPS